MKRQKIVAGNWKMNCTKDEAITLAQSIKSISVPADLMVFVSSIHLETVMNELKGSAIKVGVQNMYYLHSGAFTGEISPTQIKSYGCDLVLIGHSERRSIFGETNELLRYKVNAAIEYQLTPVFCFGETIEERESGQEEAIVLQQLEESVFQLNDQEFRQVVLAYEPVWAIGTGLAATPEQAQDMHAYIRSLIAKKYSEEIADQTTILYGGSVKPSNAEEIFSKPDIDGGLIGGASLVANDFSQIASANQ